MTFKEFALELLAPSFCQNCKSLGPLLCSKCYHSLEFYFQQNFHQEMDEKFETVYPDQVIIMARLSFGLAKLIKNLKYHNARNSAPFLAQLIYRHLIIPEADLLTFVPLHPHKFRDRGYNQCEEIAITLAPILKLPLLPVLERKRHLASQAKVRDQKERLNRLKNVFIVRENYREIILNKRVLLLDDVFTTGATLNEISRILKEAGASQIIGLTLASKAK